MINTYIKKPVLIKSVKWEGNVEEIKKLEGINTFYMDKDSGGLSIETLEGRMMADLGDYVIKGIQGELYPCKPDIFEMTYEVVANGNQLLLDEFRVL